MTYNYQEMNFYSLLEIFTNPLSINGVTAELFLVTIVFYHIYSPFQVSAQFSLKTRFGPDLV